MSINRAMLGKSLGALLAVAALWLWPAQAFAQSADLSIDKSDNADPVSVGSEFAYMLTISNAGPDAASGVEVVDTLPNEVDFVSASPSQGTCALQGAKRVNCALGSVASGGSATVQLRVRAVRDGQATNSASVSGTPADSNQANNEDSERTTIQQPGAGATCAGQAATVVGTAGADSLTGTGKRDVIAGLGGNDQIAGLDGRDIVCGGGGNDMIRSQGGADLVRAGAGDDRARGGAGDDALAGNAGNDSLGGGAGDDALRGGVGTDRCVGGPGRDTRRACE
jgi:uncharacterized repeat protein (TIGR01451 family)